MVQNALQMITNKSKTIIFYFMNKLNCVNVDDSSAPQFGQVN